MALESSLVVGTDGDASVVASLTSPALADWVAVLVSAEFVSLLLEAAESFWSAVSWLAAF